MMETRKYRINMWFFVYIAMFVPMAFLLDNWAMVLPGLIFAMLFGLERHPVQSEHGGENG